MTITMTEARKLYSAANNAGEGYAPDADDVDAAVDAMVEEDGAKVILTRQTSDDVAVVEVDGKLVAIGGDASGGMAWACEIG